MQVQFNFLKENHYLDEDYIVSSSNFAAYSYMEQYPSWPAHIYPNIVYLYGEKSSGKTHLINMWQRRSKAIYLNARDIENFSPAKIDLYSNFIIEDIEKYINYETNLFHIFNQIEQQGKFLVISSSFSAANLNFKLADLTSRLNAVYALEIMAPDDDLLKTLLIKLFSDRQLRINIEVINYILTHSERSLESINNIVELIDKKSLAVKKNITIKLVKEILG
jgi:chromosomal replication initiation ATPase DnaA